jgi:hypothetical protein
MDAGADDINRDIFYMTLMTDSILKQMKIL